GAGEGGQGQLSGRVGIPPPGFHGDEGGPRVPRAVKQPVALGAFHHRRGGEGLFIIGGDWLPWMRDFLTRSWFLRLLAAGAALAVLRPDDVRPLTDRLPLRPVVALLVFLMAWGLDGRRLWLAFARPVPVVWALAVSYGAVPALAWAVGFLLPLADLR